MPLPFFRTRTIRAAALYLLGLMRIACALMLFSYGTQKILGFPAAPRTPPVGSWPWIAGLIDITIGFLLLIGCIGRSTAFVLSGLMVLAYFFGHFPTGVFPPLNGNTVTIVLTFVFLYRAASGPAPFPLDAQLHRLHDHQNPALGSDPTSQEIHQPSTLTKGTST